MTEAIRFLIRDDAKLCAELYRASFDPPWTREQIDGSLTLATSRGWMIESEGKPAGFILCQQSSGETEILAFAVLPALRRMGLGQRLLQHAIDAARIAQSRKIFLDVADDNFAAIGLYHKAGFQLIRKRAGYYKRGDSAVAALLYQLSL